MILLYFKPARAPLVSGWWSDAPFFLRKNICTPCVPTCHARSIWNQMSSNIHMFQRTVNMLTISFLPDVLDMGLTLASAIMEAGPHSFLAAHYFTIIFIVFLSLVYYNCVTEWRYIRSLAPSLKEAIGIVKTSIAVIQYFCFVFLSNTCIIIMLLMF